MCECVCVSYARGMLLCANNGGDGDDRVVELLLAPEGAAPGERLSNP
jgi:hypothetical protein